MTAGGRGRGAAGLVLWIAFLAGALVALHAVGGKLAPPPLTDPGALNGWLEGRQPAEAAFAVLRLVAIGMAWYLLVTTFVGALARLSDTPALVRAADLLTVPAVRRILNAAAGVSIAAATFTGAAGMAAAASGGERSPAPDEEVMRLLPEEDERSTASLPTMMRLPDEEGGTASSPPPTLRRLPDEPPPAPAAHPQPAPAPAQWEIRHGQHFWAVAEEVLASAWQRPPSDAEIDGYWRRLVEENREILRDPGNPDLLYPGQVITVPPPPQPPPPPPVPEAGAPAPGS